MLSDRLPPMCPDCGAGDSDLSLQSESDGNSRSFMGSAVAVTTSRYTCSKCGKSFTHDVRREAPAAHAPPEKLPSPEAVATHSS